MMVSFISLYLCALTLTTVAACSPSIVTTSGKLLGTESTGVEIYLGVPYAKAPIGALRFAKSQLLSTDAHVERDASKFAASCMQFNHTVSTINPALLASSGHDRKMSEDCLYLNIYRPAGSEKAPIVAFLPGEGFDFADASQFDGSHLASSQNIIVITIQYRVGVFGFLSLKGIADGNMGLSDQITALEWIQKNAQSFGGDASRVTLFGRFTGSMSASLLMTSPELRNRSLFSRVILSSGVATRDWAIASNADEMSSKLLKKLNCQAADCLMSADASAILAAASYGWRPIVDGVIVSDEPITALSNKHISKGLTGVMLGTNEMDGTICLLTHLAMRSPYYAKLIADTLTNGDLADLLQFDSAVYYNNNLNKDKAIADLLARGDGSLREGYLEYCSRSLTHKPAESLSNVLKSHMSDLNVYQYRLSQRAPKSVHPSFITTAGNGDDIIYAFGLVDKETPEASLAASFMSYLSSFISHGNPGESWSKDKIRHISMRTERNDTATDSFDGVDSCTYDRKSSFAREKKAAPEANPVNGE